MSTMTTAAAAASPLETLVAALDQQPSTTHTSTTSRLLCPASRVNLQALCSCFAFLTPKELISTHATSHAWQRAAEHPLTFRSQIRVQLNSKSGLWSSGPRVIFPNPHPMELALQSSLFNNFRIVHLIASEFMSHDNFCKMFVLAARFKSLHTLKLSSYYLATDLDTIVTRLKLMGQLFSSPTCKYLQVMHFEITLPNMRQIFKNGSLLPHLQSLQQLQFTIVEHLTQRNDGILPATFASELLKLPQLRIVVVACGKLLTSLNAPLFQKPLLPSTYTTAQDMTQLMQLSQSPTLDKIAWMHPFSFKNLDSMCQAMDMSDFRREPSKFDTLYMNDVDTSQLDIFFKFIHQFFPTLTSLTIF